jgi:hypothetical protein
MTNQFWHIWTVPIILAVISLGGLIFALVGDNLWDGLSWLLLSIPLLIIGRFALKPRKGIKRLAN